MPAAAGILSESDIPSPLRMVFIVMREFLHEKLLPLTESEIYMPAEKRCEQQYLIISSAIINAAVSQCVWRPQPGTIWPQNLAKDCVHVTYVD